MFAISVSFVDLLYDRKYIPSTVIFVIHKVFMSKKMGRPKVPKAQYRGILIQARLSPEENKEIRAAIAKSPGKKSEWIRSALLSTARKDTHIS
jgi:hypothetical protein